jgi:hypothetical protein
MGITSSTFTYGLGNALGRQLVRDYRDYNLMEQILIGNRKAVRDFRDQEAILIGGYPDLATVDPEAADYDEIAGVTDEESTYTVGQKGNILTISRKTIVCDDVGLVQSRVTSLARASRRSHAKYVWNLLISNAACSDGTAWFTSVHGNLGSGALSHSSALIGWQALANMTEKDSGEVLGILANPDIKCFLAGPVALTQLLYRVANLPSYYTSNDLTSMEPNPLYGKVIPVVQPLMTDANDWALLLPPEYVCHVEMGYLGGREDPEIIEASGELFEFKVSGDKSAWKIRHEYGGTPVDYRGCYKAEVT